ncbi:unnamed protein product [Urochloa humidicola]
MPACLPACLLEVTVQALLPACLPVDKDIARVHLDRIGPGFEARHHPSPFGKTRSTRVCKPLPATPPCPRVHSTHRLYYHCQSCKLQNFVSFLKAPTERFEASSSSSLSLTKAETARNQFDFCDRMMDEGGGAAEEGSSSHVHVAGEPEEQQEVPCVLDIYVHGACGIHNICIYGNQDVYAKLSLTSAPDDAPPLTTRVAAEGGAAPRFDERLPPLRVLPSRLAVDVLKCELWMRSCATRTVLDDQLLGFALVPLAAVADSAGARLDSRDFELSSTDLFHSPAGTVRLSLSLRYGAPGDAAACPPSGPPSIASEVVILDPPPPVDYSRIEFDGLSADQENQAMAVQYLPFLQLGETTRRTAEAAMEEDAEMSTSPHGEKTQTASSDDGSKNASATSTVSDGRVVSASAAGAAEKPVIADEAATPPRSPETPTSGGGEKALDDVFTSPLGDMDMDIEAEQSAMQRQIMEMYVKSMQQFSESLPKVRLPMDLDGVVVHNNKEEQKPDDMVIRTQQQQVKKDGTRVFYGCRAFF